MTGLFVGMVVLSLLFGMGTGRMAGVSAAAIGDSAKAVELLLGLTGSLCLWSGMMAVAKAAGLTEKLAEAFSPLTRWIFKGLRPKGEAMGAIAMNLSANLLGLGNAATPLGIAAMRAIAAEERVGEEASDNMIYFVVLNTASLQLIPTTTALLRLRAGSQAPLEILVCVWISSLTAVFGALLLAKLLGRRPARLGAPGGRGR